MELESNNHSVFLMHYHLVLVVKYRRRVITDATSRARGGNDGHDAQGSGVPRLPDT